MINDNFGNVLHSNEFISTLTADLSREGADVDKIAREAIEKLQHVDTKFDKVVLGEALDIKKINDFDIQPEAKKELSKLIAQVFIGSCCEQTDRRRLDTVIAGLFSDKELSNMFRTVEYTSRFLVEQNRNINEPLIERFLQEEDLDRLVSALSNDMDIQEIVEILDLILSSPLEKLLLSEDVVKDIVILLNGITGHYHKKDILSAIREIPSDQRVDVIAKAAPFMEGNPSGFEKAEILYAIKDIPSDQRADVIAKAEPLMEGITDGYQKATILYAIGGISPDQRADVIAKAAPFTEGVTDGSQKADIFRAIGGISPDQRADVIVKAGLVMEGITDGSEKASILSAIREIPYDQRGNDVIKNIATLMNGITDEKQRAAIIEVISEIPSDERADVIAKAVSVMEGIADGLQRAGVLRAISDIPLDQRVDVIAKAVSVMEGTTDGSQKADILRAIGGISPDQRADVIVKAGLVMEGTTDGSQKADILRAIRKIPSDQRADVIAKAGLVMEGVTDGSQKAYILRAIREIPSDQRADVIAKAGLVMEGVTDGSQKTYILRAIREIPSDQRADVIAKAGLVMEGVTDGSQKTYILRAIREIPSDQRADVLAKAGPVMEGITDGDQKASILRAIGEIPSDQRDDDVIKNIATLMNDLIGRSQCGKILSAIRDVPTDQHVNDVINNIATLMNGITDVFQRLNIFDAISEIPSGQRAEIIALGVPFIEGITDGLHRADILSVISEIPSDQRGNDVIKSISTLMKSIADESLRFYIFNIIKLTPLADRNKAILFIVENPDKYLTLFSYLADNDATFLERFSNYLMERLDSVRRNRDDAYSFSSTVLKATNILLINESHPVFQRAVEINTLSDPEIQNRKNPYVLFHNLIRLEEPPLSCNPPESDGLKINIDKFREVGNVKPLAYEDLPQIEKGLLRAVLERIRNSESQREKVTAKSVKFDPDDPNSENDFDFDTLEEQLFGTNSIIPPLLSAQQGVPVGNNHLHLFTIVKAMSEENSDAQEEMLIAFGACIRECRTGQGDALALYYNALPAKFRVRKGAERDIEQMQTLIDSSVQGQINDIFSDESLFKKILSMDSISQMSHQSTYLKNRLHKHIGLKHQVGFDDGTGTLLDELLDMPVEDLFNTVIQECTPDAFIDKVERDMNILLESDQTKVQTIVRYTNAKPEVLFKEKDRREILEDIKARFPETRDRLSNLELSEDEFDALLDDFPDVAKDDIVNKNTNKQFLTKEGAKLLLLARGYLKESS